MELWLPFRDKGFQDDSVVGCKNGRRYFFETNVRAAAARISVAKTFASKHLPTNPRTPTARAATAPGAAATAAETAAASTGA